MHERNFCCTLNNIAYMQDNGKRDTYKMVHIGCTTVISNHSMSSILYQSKRDAILY